MTPPDDNPASLVAALEWLFDRVAAAPAGPLSDRDIDRLSTKYAAIAGAAGFATNLGGLLTLPVTLPANLVGTAAIQLRLIAAIAAARGHDLHSEEVRALSIACLTGTSALELLKKAGIQLGERVLTTLSAAAIARVNRMVGTRLLAQAGAAGAVGFGKAIPLLGGLVAGGIDAASTKAVGAVARRVFPPLAPPIIDHAPEPIA